ncbi:WD repeat-containing protein 43 [Leptidea sinapis]|uniref:WD repeat-containing protein 43 n=1 Tax=Leptidea sinapis TaxID=189913 RepID=UPI002121472C|nr:WD repeat-containing protein 43 [Leptidea sinapis]
MAQAAFSANGKYYSLITQDGRLKIWDTEKNVLKQEFTPDMHLTQPPTCLQWINVNSSSGRTNQEKKRKNKPLNDDSLEHIAIGMTNGSILLYSVAQAAVETVLNSQTSKKVLAVDWNIKFGLISCTVDNNIYEWSIENSSVNFVYDVSVAGANKQANKISGVKIVPYQQNPAVKHVVVASSQVRLWRLGNGKADLLKSLGHNAADGTLLVVATLNNSYWLIEGSRNERLLQFWDISQANDTQKQNGDIQQPFEKKRRRESVTNIPTPTYSFVLEDAPRMIDISIRSDDGASRMSLVAVTRSGVVHYYGHMINGPSTKPIKPSVTMHMTTPDANPIPLICCALHSSDDVLVGYKSTAAFVFERVTPDLTSKTQILIREESKSTKKSNKSKEVNKEVVGKNNDVTYVEPMGGVTSRKRQTAGAKVEGTMEARLENLAIDLKSRSKAPVCQNLTKLLMQGLHSKDKKIILTVLQRDDPDVASRTMDSLPANYIPNLLDELIEMATRRTSQCSAVCTWVRALLHSHSAMLLTSAATSAEKITSLLAIFTNRRSHLCQLLNLKGRLDLTMVQKGSKDMYTEQEAILEYNDSSSEEEVMELEQYQSSNEASEQWDDDDQVDGEHSDQDEEMESSDSE